MARVRAYEPRSLRGVVEGLSIPGFARLLFCLLCAFIARVMEWCCEACDLKFADDDGIADDIAVREDCGSFSCVESGADHRVHSLESQSGVRRKQRFYAVRNGRTPGLYFTWADCSREVTGFKGARHKSFSTLAEAEAYLRQSFDF